MKKLFKDSLGLVFDHPSFDGKNSSAKQPMHSVGAYRSHGVSTSTDCAQPKLPVSQRLLKQVLLDSNPVDSYLVTLLTLLTLFAHAPIPWALVDVVTDAMAWPQEHVDQARLDLCVEGVLNLTDAGFYELDKSSSLCQQAQTLLADSVQTQLLVEAIALAAQLIACGTIVMTSEELAAALPHWEAIAERESALPPEAIGWVCLVVGNTYSASLEYASAETWYQRGIVVLQPARQMHPLVALLNNLAQVYARQENWLDSEATYLEAIALGQQWSTTQSLDIATSYNNLAGVYKVQKRYHEAETAYLKAIELKQALLGDRHPLVALSLNNLAGLYYSQQNCIQAESLYLKALDLCRGKLGYDHPIAATSLHNLASIYLVQGDYQQAIDMGRQAVDLAEQILGIDHPDTLTYRQSLALIQSQVGSEQASGWIRGAPKVFSRWFA